MPLFLQPYLKILLSKHDVFSKVWSFDSLQEKEKANAAKKK
jgi:hypothetical protein